MVETPKDYKVTWAFWGLGKGKVQYWCPRCRAKLMSPLKEAGTTQLCPECGERFTTPGVKERGESSRPSKELIAPAPAKISIPNAKPPAKPIQPLQPLPPVMVWNRGMYCYDCGYQWNSRRNQPPRRCAHCNRQNIKQVLVEQHRFRHPYPGVGLGHHSSGCLLIIVAYAVIAVAIVSAAVVLM